MLSKLQSISTYYIFDLPEVELLIRKVAMTLRIPYLSLLPMETSIPDEEIDLVISNYAFSECERQTQLAYFDRVIKKSKRGYIIYNQIADRDFGLDYLYPRNLSSCSRSLDLMRRFVQNPFNQTSIIFSLSGTTHNFPLDVDDRSFLPRYRFFLLSFRTLK